MRDSSAIELPSMTFPSTGNFPPGTTFTISPLWTSSTATCSSLQKTQVEQTDYLHHPLQKNNNASTSTASSLVCAPRQPEGALVHKHIPDDRVVRSKSHYSGFCGLKRYKFSKSFWGLTLRNKDKCLRYIEIYKCWCLLNTMNSEWPYIRLHQKHLIQNSSE